RFEFGNVKSPEELLIPASASAPFSITIDELKFNIQLFCAEFAGLKGRWEKGGNGKSSWIDFVFYSGQETEYDLKKIDRALSGFTFKLESSGTNQPSQKASVSEKEGIMKVLWNGLQLEVPLKPDQPLNSFI
ncbi:MAG: hypothetical protein PHT07_24575, partial [Paludibacter sp.]|nr:hypothetical protein [Paludibacter sp.]